MDKKKLITASLASVAVLGAGLVAQTAHAEEATPAPAAPVAATPAETPASTPASTTPSATPADAPKDAQVTAPTEKPADTPKDAPKADDKKVDAPKADDKKEEPKADDKKADAPKADEKDAPKADDKKADVKNDVVKTAKGEPLVQADKPETLVQPENPEFGARNPEMKKILKEMEEIRAELDGAEAKGLSADRIKELKQRLADLTEAFDILNNNKPAINEVPEFDLNKLKDGTYQAPAAQDQAKKTGTLATLPNTGEASGAALTSLGLGSLLLGMVPFVKRKKD